MIEVNRLTDAGPPLSAEMIARLETQLGVALPEDYREFLSESNGGVPEKAYFACGNDADATNLWVDRFLVIDDRLAGPDPAPSTDALAFWNYHFGDVMPPEAMLIGVASRDHKLLLYLRGPRRGQVWMVDWDLVDETSGHPTAADIEKALRPLAPCFSAFYGSLYGQPRHLGPRHRG